MSLLQRLTIAIFSVLLLFAVNVVSVSRSATARSASRSTRSATRCEGQLYASTVRQDMDDLHKQLLVLVTLQ
jgi:hypothetical protein